jgi:hypothetical protein
MKTGLVSLGALLLAAAGCCCPPATPGGARPRAVERWKQLADQDGADVVPHAETVRFPSREEWGRISGRAANP